MRIDIISCVPELLVSPLSHSIVGRAQNKGLVEIHVHDLHDYGIGKHRKIDDYPYGGGGGMVLMVEPVVACIEALQRAVSYDLIVYMAPDGKVLSQDMANGFSLKGNILILCGHYKGIDERIRGHFVSCEISVGNYVLSGGELAAAVLVDSVVRLLPGVLSNEESALSDSFQDGLVAPPTYTRPADFRGLKVPEVLLSGHEAKITEWRYAKALERTKERRPGLLSDEDYGKESE